MLQDDIAESELSRLIQTWLGASSCRNELCFIFEAISVVMEMHDQVESYRRSLRMPVILAEPVFSQELRRGCGFRALRRVWVLSQLNCFIEGILDEILTSLGHEELGKRGCANGDISCLDVDLKARFVTNEELALYIGTCLRHFVGTKPPALWWDRECDIGLILGTFIHGLGNYRSMGHDPDLCFPGKIKSFSASFGACKTGVQNFNTACKAARTIFDDALEAGRMKAELEVQAAVAAAAKAAKEREEDAAVLREGGEGVEAAIKNMPKTQVENAFEFDGTDSHFVTLDRMQKFVRNSVVVSQSSKTFIEGNDVTDAVGFLPMPDARILDHRLLLLLSQILDEQPSDPNPSGLDGNKWDSARARSEFFTATIGTGADEWIGEFSGAGLGSYQCGTTHRTLNDGSDYSHGSASHELAHVAYGTDAPRYLRQLGVPMNLTRYAVCALVNVDSLSVEELLKGESMKYYGCEKGRKDREHVDEANITPTDATGQKVIQRDDKLSRIPEQFRQNEKLRTAICMSVLVYGYSSDTSSSVHSDLLSLLGTSLDSTFFDFRSIVAKHVDPEDIPDEAATKAYVENVLIPHCLQLCLYGNGPLIRDARGSQGEYETALGVSLHTEPSRPQLTPIPDPCLPLQEHSTEAVCHASALLRRVNLLRACHFICRCKDLSAMVVEKSAQQIGDLQELPVWWCPWIHDIALVVHAATNGLFSIISTRNNHPIFAKGHVEDFLRSALPQPTDGSVPGSINSSQDTTDEWIREECEKFPLMNQIERRLSFFCDFVTSKATDSSDRYCNLPMFDHGGWPRL